MPSFLFFQKRGLQTELFHGKIESRKMNSLILEAGLWKKW